MKLTRGIVDEITSNIVRREGGYTSFTNNPHDPGGATLAGITYKIYKVYCEIQNISVPSLEEFRRLDRLAINDFYAKIFYTSCPWDAWEDAALVECMMDAAVLSGEADAISFLQTACNRWIKWLMKYRSYAGPNLVVDGICGPKTCAIVEEIVNHLPHVQMETFIDDLINARMDYLIALGVNDAINWEHYARAGLTEQPQLVRYRFIAGWVNRCQELRKEVISF